MTPPPAAARTTPRRVRRLIAAGLVVTIAVITAAVLACQAPKSSPRSSSSPPSWSHSPPSPPSPPATPSRTPGNEPRNEPGTADGALPEGATVFDDTLPAVANLDPRLREALRRATTAAAQDGVTLRVNSGWRSPAYQERLLREAIATYGSEREAARWVATATTSPHVSGDAVDIGGSEATAWVSGHGAGFGLCQILRNEPWHYELRPDAPGRGCPPMYADPTQDPRMRP